MVETPSEACDIGCAEAEFARALDHVHAPGITLHLGTDQAGGAVGRIVIDYKHVETVRERHHGIDYRRGILLLVIHGDDYQTVASVFHFLFGYWGQSY